jgi:hypothetical protein
VIVLWSRNDLYKGYYDPKAGWLDLVSSRPAEGGEAHAVGEKFLFSVDEAGAFCHLGLDMSAALTTPLLERPAEVREALDAEVELPEESIPTWSVDQARGSLCVAFSGVLPAVWGRIGDNLLWLALDDGGRLAGLCFEGVSRDPGGKAQELWLEDVGL